MTDEKVPDKEELQRNWFKYNKQGQPISWRDIDSGNCMEPPGGIAHANSPPEAARARYTAATSNYDGRINGIMNANRRTGEPYWRMLGRGAINGDEYWTIARWSRLDGGDF